MYLRLFRRNKGKYDDLFRLLDPESIPRKIWKRAKMPEESKAKNPMIKKRQAGNYIELHHIKSSFDPDSLINNKYFNIKRKLRGLPHPNKYSLIEIKPAKKGRMSGMEFVTMRGVYTNKYICSGPNGSVVVRRNLYQKEGAPKCVFARRPSSVDSSLYSYVANKVRHRSNKMYSFLFMAKGGKVRRRNIKFSTNRIGKNVGSYKFYELNVTRSVS